MYLHASPDLRNFIQNGVDSNQFKDRLDNLICVVVCVIEPLNRGVIEQLNCGVSEPLITEYYN